MATTVNNKRTFAKDIATISTALDGIVEFQSIEFSQILITEHGQHNAAQRLGEYLLKNGFIRATRLASTNPRDMKVMYWTLTYTKLQ